MKKIQLSCKSGITLIALVVTIIILIVIATISVNIVMNGGLLSRSQSARKIHELQREKERLELIKGEVASDINHIGKVTVDTYIEELIKKGIVDEKDVVDNGDGSKTVITDTGYSVTIEPVGDNDIKIIIDGKVGELPPRIKKVNLTRNDTSIDVEVIAIRTEEATYSYYYKEVGEDTEKWMTVEEKVNGDRSRIDGTDENKHYIIRVVAENQYGSDTKEARTIPDAKEAVEFGEIQWKKGKASVTVIKTVEDNYTIEYNVVDSNGKQIRGYQTIASGGTIGELNHGEKVNVRLREGSFYGEEASLNVQDSIVPNSAEIKLDKTTYAEGDEIVATITQSDDQSGVNYANSRWGLTNSITKLGTTDSSKYTGGNFNKSPEEIKIIPETFGEYYIHVLTVDYAGKAVETVSGKITVEESDPLPEPPTLSDGMIPVKYVGNSWVKTTADDPAWYNYASSSKKWANIVLEDSTFTTQEDGTEVLNTSKAYSQLVWIPRYAYQITSYYHTAVTAETVGGNINIVFIDKENMNKSKTKTFSTTYPSYTVGATTGMKDYVVHPAFNFGTSKLSGIWVGKYETSSVNGNGNSLDSDNVTTKTVQIKSGVASWRWCEVTTMFDICSTINKAGNVYGLSTSKSVVDPHLMKNTEWGAVAYLSASIYGNSAIAPNTSTAYITGNGGNTSSTTGNIYGIYDMSGGAHEYVAAYVNNGNNYLNLHGSSLVAAESKYKNTYPATSSGSSADVNYGLLSPSSYYGDALYETSSTAKDSVWYGDAFEYSYSTLCFFTRGNASNASKTSQCRNFCVCIR